MRPSNRCKWIILQLQNPLAIATYSKVAYIRFKDRRALWADLPNQDHGPSLSFHGDRLGHRIIEVYRAKKPPNTEEWFLRGSPSGWTHTQDDKADGAWAARSTYHDSRMG